MNDSLNLRWEEVECAWCGSHESTTVVTSPDRMYDLPGIFTFVCCKVCGTYRQNPRLKWESLQNYYPDTYGCYTTASSDQGNILNHLSTWYEWWKRLRIIEKYQPGGGNLLDVGCGTGALLETALRSGKWLPTGVEPNEFAANYVREKLRIQVYQDTFSEADIPEQSFDAIVFWNVLEHSYDPIADLQKSYSLLKDGGWIIIGIPNVDSWERILFRSHWIGWELPRHLYLFPMTVLREVLQSLGFCWETADCMTSSHGNFYLSLKLWSGTWDNKYYFFRKILLAYNNSFIGRFAALPFWAVSNCLNVSSMITVIAQKKVS